MQDEPGRAGERSRGANGGTRAVPGRRVAFLVVLGVLVAVALVRSSRATRLDGFTIDEPLHVAAAVAGARHGDFRLNPEHPPLVKLWVGRALPDSVFALPPLRRMNDKPDERYYADEAVYGVNDPVRVQDRVRQAMLALNGLLLAAFGLAAATVCPPLASLAGVAILAADPTVAAHLPVAMTDLPVALLSATAVLLAWSGIRAGRLPGAVLAGLALGAALGTKHSAIVTGLAVALVGGFAAAGPAPVPRLRRLGLLALVGSLSFATLWGLYGFRYRESREEGDSFNRPLEEKISDVASPVLRGALRAAAQGRLLPRSYLWGLADVTRAGLEGRGFLFYAFGSSHDGTPWWFPPAVVAVKLPLGFLALAVLGVVVAARRRPPGIAAALAVTGTLAALFLVALVRSNSGYAGVRHALPLFPFLALLGGAALGAATSSRVRAVAIVLLLAGLAEGSRPGRPWEFYNVLAGGPEGAYRFFNDEGVDLGQRSRELVRLYHERFEATGEVPYIEYRLSPSLARRERIRSRSFRNSVPEAGAVPSETVSGTFLLPATALAPSPWYDWASLRDAGPTERLGNLLLFRGTYRIPWLSARWAYARAMELLYGPSRDPASAEPFLREAVRLHPQAYTASLELGNVLLERGEPEAARDAYRTAYDHAPPGSAAAAVLGERLEVLGRPGHGPLPPLRNPWLE